MDGMMDSKALRLFVAVARHASFVEAGRRLETPTSTVSRAVAGLEAALGVRLLQRTSRRVALTAEGAALLERAAPLVSELDALAEEVSGKATALTGRLRVTAPLVSGVEWVGPALLSFAAAHPGISLELELTNAVAELVEQGLDLGFRSTPPQDSALVARRLWELPFALAASAAFVKRNLQGRTRLRRAELEALPAVVLRGGGRWPFVARSGERIELRPNERVVVNDQRLVIEAARAGLGIVRLPRPLLEREGRGLTLLTCTAGEPERRALYAVYPSRKFLPRRVRAALDWVAAHGPRGG